MFLEELSSGQATDFIDSTNAPFEIDEDWDEACQEFHLIVLDNAEKTGRLEDHDCKYLQRYLSRKEYAVARGQYLYVPIPEYMARIVKVEIDGLRCIRRAPADDRLIRMYPSQYGPSREEAFFILMSSGIQSPPVSGDVTRKLRLYVYGDSDAHVVAIPLNAMTAALTFYRLVDPIAYQSPPVTLTDVEDPWADGPIHGTVARLQEKAGQMDVAQYHYQRMRDLAGKAMAAPEKAQQMPGGAA